MSVCCSIASAGARAGPRAAPQQRAAGGQGAAWPSFCMLHVRECSSKNRSLQLNTVRAGLREAVVFGGGGYTSGQGIQGRRSVQAGLFGFGGKSSKGVAGKQGCAKCRYKGSIECPGCKGSGKNKKNGNMFERYKCFDCQGFGLISCPACSKGKGLTPEQRGER